MYIFHFILERKENSTVSSPENSRIYTDEELAGYVDYNLKLMDIDQNGFISYWEYEQGYKRLKQERSQS